MTARLRMCGSCGEPGHTRKAHAPGGSLYVAPEGPDLLAALAESVAKARAERQDTMRAATRRLASGGDIPENPNPADVTPLNPITLTGADPTSGADLTNVADYIQSRTPQQLADAETAARRLDQVRRFVTPAGEIKSISGPDATPERAQGLCADGAWSRNPDDGTWSCAICGKPAAAPVLAEIASRADELPGTLVAVELAPWPLSHGEIEGGQARWEIDPGNRRINHVELNAAPDGPERNCDHDGTWHEFDVDVCPDLTPRSSAAMVQRLNEHHAAQRAAALDPGEPFPGADCDCLGDGDFHPRAAWCVVDREPEDIERLVETVASDVVDELLGGDVPPGHFDPDPGPWVPGPLAWCPDLDDPWIELGQHGPSWAPWRTWRGPDEPIRITEPGVYHLTDLEYHDPAVTGDWVSNSDLKAMTLPGSPAKWRYDRDHGVRERTAALDFGKAAHARVLGAGAEIVTRPAVNPADPEQPWPDWRTKSSRAWRAEQEAAGRIVVDADDLEVIEGMAAALAEHPAARELLAVPARRELAFFWVERLPSGRTVRRRAMLDSVPEHGPIVDYKTAESAAPDTAMSRAISRYRYHWQAVGYIAAVTAFELPCDPDIVFIFQEKTAPYLVLPTNLDDPTMVAAEFEVRDALEVYAECLATDVWPGYTDDVMTMSIPEYELRAFEEEMK